MSAFVLKLIALVIMTIDHSGYVIFGKISFMNYIGRIAFPIFAFQITEGYKHTHNLKNYFLRLCAFALISQIPFMLFESFFTDGWHLNIFFTLLLGLTAIFAYDKLDNIKCNNKFLHRLCQLIGIVIVGLLAFLGNVIHVDYVYFGVLTIFIFYLFRNHKVIMNIAFAALVLVYNYFSTIQPYLIAYGYVPDAIKSFVTFHSIFTIMPLIFIDLYNNKKGKDTKYFLYLFYPAHLLILFAIHLLISL